MKRTLTTLAVAASMVCGAVSTAQAGTTPFLGDILQVGENFCPRGWAKADGQLLPISSYTALFSLLGTNFGGDGRTTFGLPDLQARANIGIGNGPGLTPRTIGEKGGVETTTMTQLTMPSHSHSFTANFEATLHGSSQAGSTNDPAGNYLGTYAATQNAYSDGTPDTPMAEESVAVQVGGESLSPTGGGQSVNNDQPYLALTTCIAIQGQYPSRS